MNSFFGKKSHLPSSSSSSSLLPMSRLPSRSIESMATVDWHMNAYRGRSHELDLLQQLERRPGKLDEQDVLDLTLSVGPSAFRRKIELGQHVKNINNDNDDNARAVRKGCSNMCECEGKKCGNTNSVAATRSDAGGGSEGLVAAPVVTSTRGGLLKMYPHKLFDFGGGSISVNQQQVRPADNTTNIGDVRAPRGVMEAINKRKLDQREDSDGPLVKKVYERQESSGKSRDPRSIWAAYKQQSLYCSMNQDSKVDRQKIQRFISEGDDSVQPPMIQISDDDESSEDTLDVVV